MATPQTQTPTRRDLESRLVEKAWKDPDFRKAVVSDPKGMLEQHMGKKLPADVKIYVHEEDANTLHFSIPPTPSNLHELSDQDLERVAGGTDVLITGALLLGTAELAAYTAAAAVTVATAAVGTAAASLSGQPGW